MWGGRGRSLSTLNSSTVKADPVNEVANTLKAWCVVLARVHEWARARMHAHTVGLSRRRGS